MQVLKFSANQISVESNDTYGFTVQNCSKLKTSLDEEMQPVVLEKIVSDTKKHHKYT